MDRRDTSKTQNRGDITDSQGEVTVEVSRDSNPERQGREIDPEIISREKRPRRTTGNDKF